MKTNGKTAYPERPRKVAGLHEPETGKLARSIAAYAPHDGTFDLRIPGLHASRLSRTNTVSVHALQLPALCIIVQRAKTVIVGQDLPNPACTQLPRSFPGCGLTFPSP